MADIYEQAHFDEDPGEVYITPEERFADLLRYDFAPNYIEWRGLKMHYTDEGPKDGSQKGTFLMVHGNPGWSYLYHDWIPQLVQDGYRCIALDLIGHGRSDKPTNRNWYSVRKHIDSVSHLISALNLTSVNLVVQDWGGIIGLSNILTRPNLFDRLFIFNTAIAHHGFHFAEGLQVWKETTRDPAKYATDMPVGDIVSMSLRVNTAEKDEMKTAFDAPWPDLKSKASIMQFPFLIPYDDDRSPLRNLCEDVFQALKKWDHCPVHFVFGDDDWTYPWDWAVEWSSQVPGATLDRIQGASHFVQIENADACVGAIRNRLAA